MKTFESLQHVAAFFSMWLSRPFTFESIYRSMLACPVRYNPPNNVYLREQFVPAEGAVSHVEGVALYALARATGAQDILELGTFAGHSTNYLAEAARYTGGHVHTVDLVWFWGRVLRGHAITLRNRFITTQHKSDAFDYLLSLDEDSMDFIFEDTDHTYHNTKALIMMSARVLRSGGILAVHDVAVSEIPECQVYEAVRDSGLDFTSFTVWPGEQGLAIWRKP